MKFRNIIFSWDNVIASLIVFLIIKHLTIYQNLDFLNPFINTIQDLNITDVVFSKVQNDGRYGLDTNIVLVNIGLLPRESIAREIEIINKYEPKVIGIDSFFKTLKNEEQDSALIRVLAEVNNLVMASKINYSYSKDKFDSITYSHPEFTKNAMFGFANVSEDLQGKTYKDMTEDEKNEFNNKFMKSIREISPKEYVNNKMEVFLAVKIAQIVNPQKARKFIERDNDKEIVNYRRNIDKFTTIDVNEVFEGSSKLEKIRGKAVLLGFLGPDLKTKVSEDAFYTPMNPQYVGKTHPDMYGLVIHANVLSMILDESYYYSLPDTMTDIFTMIILYLIMMSLRFLRIKYDKYYEPLSIGLMFGNMILWFGIILTMFNSLRIFADLSGLFFIILLCNPAFEAYQDSLKPLAIKRYHAIANYIRNKKKSQTQIEESE